MKAKYQFILSKIILKNYKKYSEQEFVFSKQFNLLEGVNATGKTTILDGIATLIGGFLQGFSNIASKELHPIKKNDILKKYKMTENGVQEESRYPTIIKGIINSNEQEIAIMRANKTLKSATVLSKKENKELYIYVKKIENRLSDDEIILPVFSYHGTGRLWEQDYKNSSKMENLNRLDGYKDCLNAKSNYRNFVAWFEKLDRHAYSTKTSNIILNTTKNIIGQLLSDLTQKEINTITYRDGDLELYYKNSDEIDRVGLLSDGYRNIIGIVADIAYRMAILNPQLKENINETPGIVIIDEIDLHLHPKWQKNICNILKKLFPNIQFIVSSHSPFIIQSMESEEIISLDNNERLMANGTQMSIEDIAENIMQVENPQMSEKKKKMLDAAREYFEILENLEKNIVSEKEVEKLKNKLDELSLPYEDNPAYSAFLERKRMVTEAKMEKKS